MASFDYSTSSILGFAIGSVVIHRCWILFYRLLFHPLACIPGPRLAGLTSLYESYYQIVKNGQYPFKVEELHVQYGPIIRTRPNEVHIDDPSFYEEIFNVKGRWDRSFDTQGIGAPNTMFTTMSHDLHKSRRAPVAPFFTRRRIAALEPVLQEQIEKLYGRLKKFARSSKAFGLRMAFSALTMDSIGVYAIGMEYNNLDQENFNEKFHHMVEEMGPIYNLHKQLPWIISVFNIIPAGWVRSFSPGAGAFKDLQKDCYDRVDALKAAGTDLTTKSANKDDRDSIFHTILEDPSLPLSEKATNRLGEEALGIMSAGTATTAQTITYMTFQVCRNPTIYRKLRDELRDTPGPRPISLQQLEQFPYLTGVVKEALRLGFPSTTKNGRIAPDRTIVYNERNVNPRSSQEWVIPPGTHITISTWYMHRDRRVWGPDAAIFDPDRWAKASQEQRRQYDRYWVPFARGTRMCVGSNLALAEIYMTAAMMFGRDLEIELVDSREDDMDVVADMFLSRYKREGITAVVKSIDTKGDEC